jgi:hypothetical protein
MLRGTSPCTVLANFHGALALAGIAGGASFPAVPAQGKSRRVSARG